MTGGGDLRRTMRLFGRFTVGERRGFVFATLLLSLEAATAVAVPDLIKRLTDFLIDEQRPNLLGFTPAVDATIPLIALAIVLVTALNSSSASLAVIYLAKAARTLGFNVRGTLFAHLQRLPLAFHLRRSTGDVLTRLTGDVKAMEDFVEGSFGEIVGGLMILAATLAYLFGQSPQVALLALAVVPLLMVVSSVFTRRIKKASKRLRASEGDLASTAQEMLATISLTQVYGGADREAQKFAKQSRAARDAVLQTGKLEAFFGFTVAVLEAVGIALVILVGARLVSSRTLTAGDLVAFILLIQNMFKPIRKIIKHWNRVASVYASVERVGELLDRQATVTDAPDAQAAPPLRGEIEFRDVSFAYQARADDEGSVGRLALQSLSFRMAPGEAVALVGHSGAGKSTIAQLLPRLYDPHAGAVLIDGHDIREFTLESLRSRISMVLQETVLLTGTIGENIAYGREGATAEDVVRAAQQANAHDFVMAMPDGYDTVLGERAATLSGGQRQRLAIARAFIRDAPILILDEPTTGLDAESSALVAEALQTLARNRSTLIVSHDFNLIRAVDRVLVISAGRIHEEGSPADLLASGGLYADLHARQFGDEAALAGAPGSPAASGNGRGDQFRPEVPAPAGGSASDSTSPREVRRMDTVLARALPPPATREEFLELTGWIPTMRRPSPGEDGLDPLQSAALSRALPGLAEALTAPAMAPRLQRMLAEDWELLACSPGKAFVEPGEGATMQYRLELRRRGVAGTVEHLVAGRLFPTVEEAEAWLSQVEGLAVHLDRRDDLRAFARPALVVRELCLVLHAFPLDPGLPGLVRATDRTDLAELLGQQLTGSVPGLFLQSCRAEVVRYGRDSCVLRYELAWRLQSSRRSLKQVVYGKVYSGGEGGLVGPVVTALRQHAPNGSGAALPFLVPRFQAYLPELRLALVEAVPGSPLLPALLRGRAGGDGASAVPGPTAESAVAACARIAAALHRTSVPVGPSRTFADEVAGVGAAVDALAPLAPALAGSLHRHLGALGDLALDRPGPSGVAHGDFDPSQVLFDGPTTGVVDFDTVCLAEPALDLGSFTARLAVAVRLGEDAAGPTAGGSQDLVSAFLREYQRVSGSDDPQALLAREAAYRTVALTRLAVRSWCRLKPQRLRSTVALLDEPQRIRVP